MALTLRSLGKRSLNDTICGLVTEAPKDMPSKVRMEPHVHRNRIPRGLEQITLPVLPAGLLVHGRDFTRVTDNPQLRVSSIGKGMQHVITKLHNKDSWAITRTNVSHSTSKLIDVFFYMIAERSLCMVLRILIKVCHAVIQKKLEEWMLWSRVEEVLNDHAVLLAKDGGVHPRFLRHEKNVITGVDLLRQKLRKASERSHTVEVEVHVQPSEVVGDQRPRHVGHVHSSQAREQRQVLLVLGRYEPEQVVVVVASHLHVSVESLAARLPVCHLRSGIAVILPHDVDELREGSVEARPVRDPELGTGEGGDGHDGRGGGKPRGEQLERQGGEQDAEQEPESAVHLKRERHQEEEGTRQWLQGEVSWKVGNELYEESAERLDTCDGQGGTRRYALRHLAVTSPR